MSPEERELIKEKFKGITIQMDAEFTVVHQSLGYIKDQVDLQNGRLIKLEANEIQNKINCPQKGRIEGIEESLLEYKMIKKYPKFFIISSVLIGIGLILIAMSQIGII